jgi:hypothetical protein
MALLDLSLVTRALVRLVDEAIKISPAAPSTLVVTSLPPDKLNEDNSVGIYLYHLVEEAALKNQPWRGRPPAPSRYSPLGLNLHYVITTHSTATDQHDPFGPYREQLLLGLALKALHDYPVIDDATEIGGARILDASLIGDENKLRLALRHVPATEAVSYWTAGSQPLRLSAYCEVSVVLLEPEEPASAGGRVLTWGVEAFVGGLPRLSASRSTVRFTIPGEPAPRALEVQPAQAAIGDEIALIGSGLGGGAIEVLVRGSGWPAARPVGPTWGTSAAGDRVFTTVQDLIDGAPALPGAYAASVQVTRTTTLPDGRSQTSAFLSSETPFQIVPAVTSVGAPSPAGVFAITGGRYSDPSTPVVARASIAAVQLSPGTAGALAPGEFAVTSPTAMELRLPAGAPSGQALPVRVVINGAESPPRWVVVP